MKFLFKILPFVIALMASSCNNDEGGALSLMPQSTGRCGEVLVVMKNDAWKSPIGDTVTAWLRQEYLVLPQYEPTLKVINVSPSGYTSLFRRTRNVIYADIDPKNTKSELSVETNKYSAPQLYITIKAPSDSAFLASWYKVEKYVLDTITRTEQSRFLVGFKRSENIYAEDTLRKRNIKMIVPQSGFNMDVDSTHFIWISKETNSSSQGLLIFDYPYTGPHNFGLQYMINKMDSVLMMNVPGPTQGSYMAIEKRLEPIKYEYGRNGNYLCEIRGLWETEGDFMGGPFISQSMVDTVNNKLITVFSYVYGGKKDKKIMMWQLEAIMSTFNLYYPEADKKE